MPDIMKMGQNPNYLGSWDLYELPNQEVTLTIARFVDEDVVTNGSKERCTVCYWAEKDWKPMIFNLTNKKLVAKLHHTKDSEKLKGKAVVVGIEKVKAFGDIHDALRIKKKLPKVTAPAEKCTDCGGDIKPAMGKSADYMISYTKKQFGTCLCFDCAMKRKAVTDNGSTAEADRS